MQSSTVDHYHQILALSIVYYNKFNNYYLTERKCNISE